MPVSACSAAPQHHEKTRGNPNERTRYDIPGETMSTFDAQFAGRLDGQTVLVTGAKGSIGYETAKGIGNSGATVLVHARGADDARHAVDLLVTNGNGKGRYLAVAGDLG